MAVNRFAEETGVGRCHADAPDCGCQWPVMEATVWMAHAQRNPEAMAVLMNQAAVAVLDPIQLGIWKAVSADDVREMVRNGTMERWISTIEASMHPEN